jgi:CxxC-x17-CxxC domain-containing protein
MHFEDKSLDCTECSIKFVFSAGEQEFFHTRNLGNVPKRCPNCRLTLRYARAGRDVAHFSEVNCADCEKPTRVPFRPKGYKPVYCNDCLARRKSASMQVGNDAELFLTPAGHA